MVSKEKGGCELVEEANNTAKELEMEIQRSITEIEKDRGAARLQFLPCGTGHCGVGST